MNVSDDDDNSQRIKIINGFLKIYTQTIFL